MISKRTIYTFLVFEVALLIIVTMLTYLPSLTKATIYRDDWYYVLDRTLGGPQAFGLLITILTVSCGEGKPCG